MNRRDIVKAQFSRAFRGYDVREVDEFLDRISECLDANEIEIETLKKKNAELSRALMRERRDDVINAESQSGKQAKTDDAAHSADKKE